ncbi:PCI domain protein, partial [Gregarina niphandrodes]
MRQNISWQALSEAYSKAVENIKTKEPQAMAQYLKELAERNGPIEEAKAKEEQKRLREEQAAKKRTAEDNKQTDGDKKQTDGDKKQTDGDKKQTDGDKKQTDGDKKATDDLDTAMDEEPTVSTAPVRRLQDISEFSVLSLKWLHLLALFALVDDYLAAAAATASAVDKRPTHSADTAMLVERPTVSAVQGWLGSVGLPVCRLCLKLIHSSKEASSDTLDSKIYFAISRVYTLSGREEDLCELFLQEYRSAVLARHQLCIATLINQLTQSYLATGQYSAALQFTTLSQFPEDIRSTPQIVRCLYNLGRIQAIRLEYASALEKLRAAINKLPSHADYAFGFRLQACKYAIVVELLLGDIPAIQIFQTPQLGPKLDCYKQLVLAVRHGDMIKFNHVLTESTETFRKDGTLFLVERLHHSVIRVGLRKINLAYKRIKLEDIAKILHIQSVPDTESVVAKAIVDGVVNGYIDRDLKCLVSK